LTSPKKTRFANFDTISIIFQHKEVFKAEMKIERKSTLPTAELVSLAPQASLQLAKGSKNDWNLCFLCYFFNLYSGDFLTTYDPILRFFVTFYSVYEVTCDQKLEYETIKSSIVRISPLYL